MPSASAKGRLTQFMLVLAPQTPFLLKPEPSEIQTQGGLEPGHGLCLEKLSLCRGWRVLLLVSSSQGPGRGWISGVRVHGAGQHGQQPDGDPEAQL